MAPDPSDRVSFGHWLMIGGMGPSPTKAKLLRMTSERKAAHREEKGYAEERKKALAEFEEQWGPVSAGLGANRRKKPGRAELMETYGPKGSKRDKANPIIVHNGGDNGGSAVGDADDIASNVASVAGSGGAASIAGSAGAASVAGSNSVASVAGSDGARAATDGDD
ncbi:hypothetical protein SLS62_000160 [Diatrype stigma]|uniref:Uncharacterized protein n=1 Tax=Diatrype stigma TaxID=117547 RepID=A0AAN9V2C1_9PEZI